MPTNNKSRTQPTSGALTRREIEEIATQAAYREVQRIFGELDTQQEPIPLEEARVALDIAPTPVVEAQPIPHATGEHRFIAHLPPRENEANEVRGTRNLATGQVVLDDAQGVYGSWEVFITAYGAKDRTPTEIVME